MGAFVVTVEFAIEHDRVEHFLGLVAENARLSLDEPGCRQFDVMRSFEDPHRVLLFEVYNDVDAFERHLTMPYVKAFFAAADGLIKERKLGKYDRHFPHVSI